MRRRFLLSFFIFHVSRLRVCECLCARLHVDAPPPSAAASAARRSSRWRRSSDAQDATSGVLIFPCVESKKSWRSVPCSLSYSSACRICVGAGQGERHGGCGGGLGGRRDRDRGARAPPRGALAHSPSRTCQSPRRAAPPGIPSPRSPGSGRGSPPRCPRRRSSRRSAPSPPAPGAPSPPWTRRGAGRGRRRGSRRGRARPQS